VDYGAKNAPNPPYTSTSGCVDMLKLFKQCWRGEAPLGKIFWIIFVLNNLIIITLMDLLVDYFVAGEFTPFYIHNQFFDLIVTLSFPYLFFSAMCVWISGKNSSIGWSILSKIIVIIPLIFCSFHLSG
jgi:hypothetical protein